MPSFNTEISTLKDIVANANAGDTKLPAFQRKWKWSKQQVVSLYDSLRMGYPIGSILTMTSEDIVKLNPRPFHGVSKKAEANKKVSTLILDGQQRITAGIAIYFGISQEHGTEYYVDVRKLISLANEKKLNLEDKDAITQFAARIDIEDGYLVSKPKRKDRSVHLIKSGLIWTPYLTAEREDEYNELLDDIYEKKDEEKLFIRKVIKPHFFPNLGHQVPMIELPKHFDLASVSRVFTTINTTGKLLTPFELVVAVLFPHGIYVEEDIEAFKAKHNYYSNMDTHGEILLQTIALLSGKTPKKSELPNSVDNVNYEKFAERSASLLNKLGAFLTDRVGLALDVKNKYIPYDAAFAPMALALDYAENQPSAAKKGSAKERLETWFVGAVLSQRYQEGVHNKQSKDLMDYKQWVDKEVKPDWLEEVLVPLHLKSATPAGALGKLIVCTLNRAKPKDPVQGDVVGYFNKAPTTNDHHIFPTRWAAKGLEDGEAKNGEYSINLALNLMLLSNETNGDWLNFSPRDQINNALLARGHKIFEESYHPQFISDEALEILKKETLKVADYERFIELRYKALANYFATNYGFTLPGKANKEEEEDEDLQEPIE